MTVQPHHPLAELIAVKLHGIESVPVEEQRKMKNRAIRAAVEYYQSHNIASPKSIICPYCELRLICANNVIKHGDLCVEATSRLRE